MRMNTQYEAYFDDFNKLTVYMSKNFFKGSSRIFHIKDSRDRIIHLHIAAKDDLQNNFTKYTLTLESPLVMGEEYVVYDEHAQKAYCQYSHIVKTARFDSEYAYLKDDLGCTYTPEKTTFKFWSPVAHRILLCLKENEVQTMVEMQRQEKGVFACTIERDLLDARYTLMVRVNGQWKETVDPYSSFIGPNTSYSVVQDIANVSLPEKILLPKMESDTDAVIYETSIRDMTSESGIGVHNPRKFVGFTEENLTTQSMNTGFSYIRSLGITHIQLMPVFDFGSVDEIYTRIFYNWGYDPVHHRCLEGSYATDCTDGKVRIKELADLVHNCHAAGLRVNLDLVFNHVYAKERYPLEILMPNYYFLMNTEGEFSNGSFCGNDIDTQPSMSRKYFLDTCLRIVKWFDVDGFRFDLMGILDYKLINEIREKCREIKPDFMIYGEGWNMPSFVPEDLRASMNNQAKMPGVGHFNDRFRDTCKGPNGALETKGFSNGDTGKLKSMQECLTGGCFNNQFDSPLKSVNYVECHDNHTLWDKNQICCQNESRGVMMQRQTLANAMVLLAQGIPFLHSGQEFGRTKYGLDNSYNRSDLYNHIDYNLRNKHMPIVVDTKMLIRIRKEHPCFRLRTNDEIRKNVSFEHISHKVLVYKAQSGSDRCMVFFNPDPQSYSYNTNAEVQVLFDNGNVNPKTTYQVSIAPYSVVVVSFVN